MRDFYVFRWMTAILSVAALVALPACSRGNKEAPTPTISTNEGEKKQSTFQRWMAKDLGPQYTWDGQWSAIAFDKGPDLIFNKTLDVMNVMQFKVNSDESHRTGANASIEAVKADKTTASIRITSKTPTSTEVKVKVGTVGDRTGSERVLDELQRLLKPPARRAQPENAPAPAKR